jgi:hypothetical protein
VPSAHSDPPYGRVLQPDGLLAVWNDRRRRSAELVAARQQATRLGEVQFAFPRNALMRFVGALDAIFTLTIVIGENLNHFIDTTWHISDD